MVSEADIRKAANVFRLAIKEQYDELRQKDYLPVQAESNLQLLVDKLTLCIRRREKEKHS